MGGSAGFPNDSISRAYLMSVDFEEPIDSESDILKQGRFLFLPGGTPLINMFLTSPSAAQRAVGKFTVDNGKTYYRIKGRLPFELEDQVIHNGMIQEDHSSLLSGNEPRNIICRRLVSARRAPS